MATWRNLRLSLLAWLLPAWARPRHPLLQYELSHLRSGKARRNVLRGLALISPLIIGLAFVYAHVADLAQSPQSLSRRLWQSLYFPLLATQALTFIAAFWLGAASIEGERRRNTWDSLRSTESGADLALRARWIAILYRLASPILAIYSLRFPMLCALLWELGAFNAGMIDMLAGAAHPPISDGRGALALIVWNLTLGSLLPIIALAAASALGILLSVTLRERVALAALGALLTIGYLAAVGWSLLAVTSAIDAGQSGSAGSLLAFSVSADWGLLQLHLGSLEDIWRGIPHSALVLAGSGLAAAALAIAGDAMIALASRLAERRG